jgi:hypothetical protein
MGRPGSRMIHEPGDLPRLKCQYLRREGESFTWIKKALLGLFIFSLLI